jgi:hypothetical protein
MRGSQQTEHQMKKIVFYSQNEETDGDGFYPQGEAAITAELRALRKAGAPEVDKIFIIQVQPIDRDEAEVEAYATDAFEAWAREQEILIEDENQ